MTRPAGPARSSVASSEETDGEVVVELDGIAKRYPERRSWGRTLRHPFSGRKVTVLHDIRGEVRRGEFFGLLGPNGAGKTTLFKILATVVLPDEGTARVLGSDVVREPHRVRSVLSPVIADERSLYWRLTATENLEVFAALHGMDDRRAKARIDELLGVVGLADTGRKMVGQFSSGMKQRLLIARALLSRPRVLLLDEPTRSLDPVSARDFRRFLREQVAGREGCTVLLATHNADEALELCDRVGVLDRGRLLTVGSADELLDRYGDDRYRAWVCGAHRRTLEGLVRDGTLEGYEPLPPDRTGWERVDLTMAGGPSSAADVLSRLAFGGVAVSRFERVTLTLADLLERIVQMETAPDAPRGSEGEAGTGGARLREGMTAVRRGGLR